MQKLSGFHSYKIIFASANVISPISGVLVALINLCVRKIMKCAENQLVNNKGAFLKDFNFSMSSLRQSLVKFERKSAVFSLAVKFTKAALIKEGLDFFF
ncbi:hypothetical protein BIV59_03065 [Bacillus sp. MUM 13]|nr:hypothetical protein BIV59_03065 [Bacillus sp. MUM 13]